MTKVRNSYRKTCRKKKNQYKIDNANNLLKLSKVDSKQFWNKIKKRNVASTPKCKFDDHFKNLYASACPNLSDDTKTKLHDFDSLPLLSFNVFLDSNISMIELENAIKQLKNDKSAGFDRVINEFLKYNTFLFKCTLLKLFNFFFNKSYFPKAWSIGLIIPIFKQGDVNNADNYRGITLLSCIGKLFTGILNRRLNQWAENDNILDSHQYGFRENKSTVDALFILQNIVDVFFEKNKCLYVSFIDLRKAFDSASHHAMWLKLFNNGVNSKIIKLLKDMYLKIKLCVKSTFNRNMSTSICQCVEPSSNNSNFCTLCNFDVNNACFFSPKAGVCQGESLSPFLFSLFINDINTFMMEDPNVGISFYQIYIILLLFADDMVLFSETRQGLQQGLNRLHDYCVDWGLSVNANKTKCLVFKKGGKANARDKWFYNNEPLETVSSFKYLGFIFSSSGKFKVGLDNVYYKGQGALFKMISNVVDFDSMYPNVQLSLFNSLVASVLSYGCEVWGFAEAKKIETFHLSFLKHMLKVKKSTPNCIVYKECQRYPLYFDRLFRIIKFWLKIIALNENEPLKVIYYTTIELNKSNSFDKSNFWAINVRNILYKNGFGHIWESQQHGIDKCFFSLFKKRLMDSFWQTNNADIDSLSVHRLYRHLEYNDYLFTMPNNYIRIALTRLRLGSHHLSSERGRWNRTEFHERKCIICDDVEDEYHFVLCCPRYHELRSKYIPKTLYQRPSMFKFIEFLNCKDMLSLKNLGLYLFHAFKKYVDEDVF